MKPQHVSDLAHVEIILVQVHLGDEAMDDESNLYFKFDICKFFYYKACEISNF